MPWNSNADALSPRATVAVTQNLLLAEHAGIDDIAEAIRKTQAQGAALARLSAVVHSRRSA